MQRLAPAAATGAGDPHRVLRPCRAAGLCPASDDFHAVATTGRTASVITIRSIPGSAACPVARRHWEGQASSRAPTRLGSVVHATIVRCARHRFGPNPGVHDLQGSDPYRAAQRSRPRRGACGHTILRLSTSRSRRCGEAAGVQPEIATRPPSAQQLPAVVQLRLQIGELALIFRGERMSLRAPGAQSVLLRDQLIDTSDRAGVVVHSAPFLPRCRAVAMHQPECAAPIGAADPRLPCTPSVL